MSKMDLSVRTRISALLLLPLAAMVPAAMHGQGAAPDVQTIVSRMASARIENLASLRPYRVTRDYKLFARGNQTPRSEVVADVSFVPPHSKQFVILHANGTGFGEKVVRQMLEQETEIVKNGQDTDLSPANYEFRFAGEEDLDGRHCYVLETRPRRKDKALIRGHIWVDSSTFLLHRVEGEPSKAPSWWLRDARITLTYGEADGMWLQTASESSADVRLLGRHTMQSRDVGYKMNDLVAAGGTAGRVGR